MPGRILSTFLIWRVCLFITAFLAVYLIHAFGAKFPYTDQVLKITHLPSWVWGFGNFDGVHYLRIAQNGYSAEYSQAFFPLYPLLINFITDINVLIPKNGTLDTRIYVDPNYFYSAIVLSNIFFALALYSLYKLFQLDFDQKTAFKAILLLLAFPTSFYFGSIYTESLFLLLTILTFYFMRKGNFLVSGVFISLAAATRIFGLILIPALLVEVYFKVKNNQFKKDLNLIKMIIGVFVAPIGILLYTFYLKVNFDNPLYFLTAQPNFGAERSSQAIILLPQVVFRYLKIFVSVPVNSLPFFNALLEFSFTAGLLITLVLFFKKMRLSYCIFTLGCLLLPTLTGTFSSMPRYSLMGFLLLPLIVNKYFKIVLFFFIILEIILVSLFTRGYWVS